MDKFTIALIIFFFGSVFFGMLFASIFKNVETTFEKIIAVVTPIILGVAGEMLVITNYFDLGNPGLFDLIKIPVFQAEAPKAFTVLAVGLIVGAFITSKKDLFSLENDS